MVEVSTYVTLQFVCFTEAQSEVEKWPPPKSSLCLLTLEKIWPTLPPPTKHTELETFNSTKVIFQDFHHFGGLLYTHLVGLI